MKAKENKFYLIMFTSLKIAFFSAVSIILIISLILFLLKALQLPRHLVVIYTTMLYTVFFFIARSGTGIKKGHWQLNFYEESEKEDKISALSKRRSLVSKIFSVTYILLGIFTVMFLTPALIIYWISPTEESFSLIMLSAFILSMIAAWIYYIKNEEKYQSRTERLLFHMGSCLGSIIACYLYLEIRSIIK
jgi:uncharacterized protein YqhQ